MFTVSKAWEKSIATRTVLWGSFLIEASGYGIEYGVKSCSGGVLGFEAMLVIQNGEVRFDYGVND